MFYTIIAAVAFILSGLLFALAMALSFLEGTLVIPGLAPGMKLGLANIVVMYGRTQKQGTSLTEIMAENSNLLKRQLMESA